MKGAWTIPAAGEHDGSSVAEWSAMLVSDSHFDGLLWWL
jgi:hypothetical protein